MRLTFLLLFVLSQALALPEIGKPAPPLTVDELIGAPAGVNLSWDKGLRERTVVLKFWATWCTPCREQIPHLNSLVRKYRDRPVTFLSLTDEDDLPLIQRFLEELPIEGLVGIDRRSQTFKRYGVTGRPTTVLVDASGVVAAVLTSKRLTEQMLDMLLEGKPIPPNDVRSSAAATASSDRVLELRLAPAAPVSVSGFSPGATSRTGNTLQAWGLDMKKLVALAYQWPEDRILVSDDIPKNRYDLSLITPTGSWRESAGLLKQALENAFGIRAWSEMRATEVYVLDGDPAGTKNLRAGAEGSSTRIWPNGDKLTAVNATFRQLADALGQILGKAVIDETRANKRYDFQLRIDGTQFDSISPALKSELGLVLSPAVREREYLIIK